MIKIIFVLVINAYHGGLTTIDFTTRQQCETAKEQVANIRTSAVCIEKQVPLKKTKCNVTNKFSGSSGTYYPVTLECVEE